MVRGRIRYSVGNPHKPGDPWGRSDLEIDTDGATRLAHQSRQGQQAWTGRFTALEELFAALERAGFPDFPRHPVTAGATVCLLSVGDSTAYIAHHEAPRLAGYDAAFRLLDTA